MICHSKGRTMFLLLKLMLICFSTCEVVKRKAPNGKLYLFSDRKSCVSVQSEEPCTLSWQLNPYVAKTYKQANEILASSIQLYKHFGIVDRCVQALKRSACSQVIPKCSGVDGTNDYGDTSKLCKEVSTFCPQRLVRILKKNNFCQGKIWKTGKQPMASCVAPSTIIDGVCPQPEFKMPSDILEDYKKTSLDLVKGFKELKDLKYDNGARVFSDECILQLEDIKCSPLYCSANESQLLVKHDQEDCNQMIKQCFDEILTKPVDLDHVGSTARKLVEHYRKILKSACETYPKSSAQLLVEPLVSTVAEPTISSTTSYPVYRGYEVASAGNNQYTYPILMATIIYFLIKTCL